MRRIKADPEFGAAEVALLTSGVKCKMVATPQVDRVRLDDTSSSSAPADSSRYAGFSPAIRSAWKPELRIEFRAVRGFEHGQFGDAKYLGDNLPYLGCCRIVCL